MFDWLKRKLGGGADPAAPKPDVVGVGKILGPAESKARSNAKPDSAVSSLMLAAKLREIGVSSEVTKLLEKYHFRVRVEEVQELLEKWSRDLEYEGYKIEMTPDKVVWVMIGVHQLQIERAKKIKDLDTLMKRSLTPEDRERSFNLRVELGKPVNVVGVLIWQEAERLLRQEVPDDNKEPDPLEVELVVERLRQSAWKAKANRLANAEARFELRKKYPGQPLPEDEFKELGLRHFTEYTKKHPFNPGAGFGKI